MQNETKQCNRCKNKFTLEQNDFSFYKKMKVPPPNVCPDCRFKMRAMWRNEMSLYSGRKCDMCKKNIVTMYNPKLPYKIYCYDCYISDKWDAKDYKQKYILDKNFLEQFKNILLKVPKKNTSIDPASGLNVNSEYANMAGGMRNCYMVFNGGVGEDILYSRGTRKSKEVSDVYFGEHLERCYECVNIQKSSGLTFSKNAVNCIDCHLILNGNNLIDCFGCVNLRNKSNYWFNEQLSKEEYLKRIRKVKGSYQKIEQLKKDFEKFCKTLPQKENNNLKTIDSTGDYLLECKNIKNSFEIIKAENSKNLFFARHIKDSSDLIGFGAQSELLLECVAVGFSSHIIGCYSVANSQNILYSSNLNNCHDCIGCDGLRNVEYCILNKQYEKIEYEKIKEHIIKELTEQGIYGLMMPPEIAPFAYNETIAQDNMPLTKEEALSQGFRWEDDIQMTTEKETLQPEEIPDHIKDVNDSITNKILKCISCERNYKIIEQELLFYRKMNLPIPRQCFFCRHKDRVRRRGPFKLFIRKCSNCRKDTYTNLTEESAPIMYCEKCYQQEFI